MTDPTGIDALIERLDAESAAVGRNGISLRYSFEAWEVKALISELRQERERADGLVAVNLDQRRVLSDVRTEHHGTAEVIGGLMIERDEARAALSRAEEAIEAVKVARSNHPECPVVYGGISCGWKRAVQDMDAAVTEYDNQKGADRG